MKRGHQVTVMGRPYPFSSFWEDGIRYYPIPSVSDNPRLIGSVFSIFCQVLFKRPNQLKSIFNTLIEDYKVNRFIKGRKAYLLHFVQLGACKILKADVIHNQWSPALALIEPLFKHYPIVQSLHGRLEDVEPYFNLNTAKIYERFFPSVSGFQCDSERLLENARNFGANTSNTYVSYSLVNQKWLDHERKYYTQTGKFKILSIGKFAWRKGYIHAIDAMRLLKNQGIPFEYHIIGWGDPTDLNFHKADHKLEEVSLHCNLSHDEVLGILKKMDALLIASVEEGFATVATEAMAVGVPLITTDCGGMAELIEHKTHGWLIHQRDPDAIAEAVKDLKNTSDEKLASITNNAKQLVQDRLIWENQIHQYEQVYHQSLNSEWIKQEGLSSVY